MREIHYLYLARSGRAYKIGRTSKDPRRRVSQLRREMRERGRRMPGSPPLVLLHFIDGPAVQVAEAEDFLHEKYREMRIPGWGKEWLYLSETEVAWICSLRVVPFKHCPGSCHYGYFADLLRPHCKELARLQQQQQRLIAALCHNRSAQDAVKENIRQIKKREQLTDPNPVVWPRRA